MSDNLPGCKGTTSRLCFCTVRQTNTRRGKSPMTKSFRIVMLLLVAFLAAARVSAEQKPPANPDVGSASSAGHLPTEATVNEFLKRMFGYDSALSWKVESIKPSKDPAIAQVVVVMTSAQGQQPLTFFVSPDGHYAISGDMVPFGSDPFAPARATLEHGVQGPARGPANSPVTVVEFSDLQWPHCKAAQPT